MYGSGFNLEKDTEELRLKGAGLIPGRINIIIMISGTEK